MPGFSKLSSQIPPGRRRGLSIITPPLRDSRALEPARQVPLKGRPSFSTLTSPAGLALSSPRGVRKAVGGGAREWQLSEATVSSSAWTLPLITGCLEELIALSGRLWREEGIAGFGSPFPSHDSQVRMLDTPGNSKPPLSL